MSAGRWQRPPNWKGLRLASAFPPAFLCALELMQRCHAPRTATRAGGSGAPAVHSLRRSLYRAEYGGATRDGVPGAGGARPAGKPRPPPLPLRRLRNLAQHSPAALPPLPQAGRPHMLADIGCGSGLSCAALQEAGSAWVGTDITPEMLRLAAQVPTSRGRLALSDFCQGLPLRSACLDGAISISAVQWLCSSTDAAASTARFFAALRRCLAPGATAALQVYPEGALLAEATGGVCSACRTCFQMKAAPWILPCHR